MAGKPKEYRALVGMDWEDADGNSHRVEAGDKISGMTDDELRHHVRVGNAERWKANDTSNVKKPEDQEFEVYGVTVRHDGDSLVIKEVSK